MAYEHYQRFLTDQGVNARRLKKMNILKQNVLSSVFKYLIPSVLTMIFLSFYTTIDGFFVSRYAGSDALAGINIVIPITCVIFGTSVMLATGSGAIIGERMGQKREQEANEIFTFITIVLFVLSVAFTVVGILFLKPICIFFGKQ